MNSIEMVLDFSSNDFDGETLETLTQVLYTQLDDLDEADVSRIREISSTDAKSGNEGRPRSGRLTLIFDALKSNKILQTIITSLLGKHVKFKIKHRGKEMEFESHRFSQQEVHKLIKSFKEL